MKNFVFIFFIWSYSALCDTIRVAIDHFPPYSQIHRDGTLSGVNVDIVNLIAKNMNLTVEYVHCPWVRCLKLLENGDIDLISGVLFTEERAQIYQYINPPYESVSSNSVYFYQLASSPLITTLKDLDDKIIAVQRGVAYTPEFDNNTNLAKVEINNHSAIIRMLLNGNIDAFIYAGPAADSLIRKHDMSNRIIRSPLNFGSERNTHLILSKKSKYIIEVESFSKGITQLLADGAITKIFKNYGIDHGAPTGTLSKNNKP